ncbi:C6 zinc finger domain protein [Aspergillus costaricaensis CBS 115574]|uniref:C6 zinc finger domain protein n=1 Tax=Aspergillus costaricaensis CBS 115574 TaxID=1448317 RepID=A0ACD1IFZ2_9EURO|nr:C6 zinc finger domain protein [Aspergillus costaricaensis CBS 115574]RAK89288.1 C6 zinc finger domain protein [Aspergillus costaricaensis CBS 115574]
MRLSPSTHVRDTVIGPLRSRRGCKTCKARKVKCGQEKPSCLRCSKTGRNCEYEGPNLGTFSSTPATFSILDKPLSSAPDTVWKERRAFAYYFQHIALFIGGGLEVDFWSTIVPQICRSEPAVWDAIISLSTLFESPEPCPDIAFQRQRDVVLLNQYHRDAISWYSRSMAQVRQRLDRGDGDVLVGLVSCILFMCIEGFQGGAAQATLLYCQGVQLIVTLRAQIAAGVVSSSKTAWLEDIIVPIFIRLGATALNFSAVPVGALLPDAEHTLTQGFSSLKSAREALVLLLAEAQLFQRVCLPYFLKPEGFHPPRDLINQRLALFRRLKVWYAAFADLMETLHMKGSLSPQQISTGALLLAYHEMLYVMIGTSTCQLETANDAYLPQFQNIVDQSQVALAASARSDGSQPPLSLELGISIPLWFTSLRCREPKLRQTALSLAGQAPAVQAFYKVITGARWSQTIITIEEVCAVAMKSSEGLPESTSQLQYPYCQDFGSSTAGSDLGSQPSTPGLEFVASPYSVDSDVDTGTAVTELVPEEARIRPINLFRVQDGFPPGTTEEEIAKWSPYRDQSFMHYLRNERDPITGAWKIAHGFTPIDY